MKSNKYLIIFDTNVLNVQYDKKADFTKFYFNSTFGNVLDKIEALDIYENVNIAIPTVVWEEMKVQNLEAYCNKVEQVKKAVEKFVFPYMELVEEKDKIYEEKLVSNIQEYQNHLSERFVDIIQLDLPTKERYTSIIERAFKKKPPFEGKGGQADKGFKDALLWESVLEYAANNKDINIILYTKDKIFNEELEKEYKGLFEGREIKIFRDNLEAPLFIELEKIAKAINEYTFIPKDIDEDAELKKWLVSEEFSNQFKSYEDILGVVNKYITYCNSMVEDVNSINREKESDLNQSIQIEATLKVFFDVNNSSQIVDTYEVLLELTILDGTEYFLEDVELLEAGDEIE
ncbi:MAG: PIN domain-containing protein [Lachnospiraceae bacterium]|nr:PIN domain-containing protein [Lachnospiraceae bacterium]